MANIQSQLLEPLAPKLEKVLSQTLQRGEQVHMKLKGAFTEGLVCTESRVIILKAGLMAGQLFGASIFQSPYRNISGVEVKFNLLSGYFELSSGGMQNTPKSYWSKDKNSDPAKAPNCVALSGKIQSQRFRDACGFIIAKLNALNQSPGSVQGSSASDDVLMALEKLGQLKTSGVLSEAEFQSKKTELLSRL
jgi:Short C-terminal domain